METTQTVALATAEGADKNKETKKLLLTCKEFLSPKLIVEYCNLKLIGGSDAVRLYITASVIANARLHKNYFEQAVNIARKLHVTPELVRQAIQRQDTIFRGGFNGQRGRRNWIIVGINDKQKII